MRFSFRVNPTGGLRVIGEIPDYRLCQLEGRNGVGKTLAVHLLDLATGGQPYAHNPDAWRSLREHLGLAEIVITGLRGANKLEIQLTPQEWPTDPVASPPSLGTARLDGRDIDFRSVRNILRVLRVGGDETLTTRFQTYISADAVVVDRRNRQLDAAVELLEGVLDRLRRDVTGLSPRVLVDLEAEQRRAEARRDAAVVELRRVTGVVQKLERLDRLQAAADQLQESGHGLEASLREIEAAIIDIERKRAGLEERQRQLLPTARRQQELLTQFHRLTRQRERQAAAAKDASTKLAASLERLKLPADPGALDEALTKTESELEVLTRDRADLAIFADLAHLIRRLRDPLDAVADSGLDDEAIVILDKSRVTTRQLREGLRQRESELSRLHYQHSLLEEVDARLLALRKAIDELRDTRELLGAARHAADQLAATEAKLRQASSELGSGDGSEEYREVVEELQRLGNEHIKLIEKRAELRYRKGALEREGSEADLARDIAALRRELGVHGRPEVELESRRAVLEECRSRWKTADDELASVSVKREDFDRRLVETIGVLEQSPDYAWLRASVRDRLPASALDPLESLRRLEAIDLAISGLQDGLDTLTKTTAATAGALTALRDAIGRPPAATNPFLPGLAAYYETRFGQLLADPEIRSGLFEGGRFERLDLLRAEISWRDANDEPRRRPIEAFSSGERAFAYVLATALQCADEKAKNRVLVLDEFGAFIDADRLDRLQRFLNQRVLKPGGAHQVVIILPLRQRPDISTPENAAIQQAVAEHGYFAQEIQP